MYDYVYIIYAFVNFLDEPPVIICLSCHPRGPKEISQSYWLRAQGQPGELHIKSQCQQLIDQFNL